MLAETLLADLQVSDVVIGLIAAIAVIWAAFMTRKSAKDNTIVDRFSAFIEAYEAMATRVGKLETELDGVKQTLSGERDAHSLEREEHRHTAFLLRLALRHIANVVQWSAGQRQDPIPVPPVELLGDSMPPPSEGLRR